MSAPDQLDHSDPAPAGAEALRRSLAWHFRCHAEEPGKSYASLGIANAEAIVARMIAAARAEALREAADAWQHGQWADAPRCADRVQERIANAQHVTDWLRARVESEAGR